MSLQLTINYSETLPEVLQQTREEFEQEAKMAMAAKLFEMKRLSSIQAATLVGMNRVSFLVSLLRYGVAVVDSDLSWEELENLLIEMGDTRAARVAYYEGKLEIIMPLKEHKYFKEIIGDLIKDLADELGLDYESLGSTTWKSQELLAGVEPDNCFYIQSESLIRSNLLNNDVSQDPPPDLVLEIDITSKSLNRQPIYARLGVPEIWRYDEGVLQIYHLQAGEYIQADSSLAFPEFPVQEIPVFVVQNIAAGRRSLRQSFRAWVQSLSV